METGHTLIPLLSVVFWLNNLKFWTKKIKHLKRSKSTKNTSTKNTSTNLPLFLKLETVSKIFVEFSPRINMDRVVHIAIRQERLMAKAIERERESEWVCATRQGEATERFTLKHGIQIQTGRPSMRAQLPLTILLSSNKKHTIRSLTVENMHNSTHSYVHWKTLAAAY